jgi:LuxR family maltose regulon positive regulatory protein
MTGPLLDTKLYAPRRRRALVHRPRLGDLLDRGLDASLILVSAPPGFGKTTLVADWLASAPADRPTAWLSLDAADRDPVSFWAYVVAALRTALPDVGAGALALLRDSQPPAIETVLATLLNELGAAAVGDVVLVLDDYHTVDGPEIAAGMTFLLDHLPSQVHLAITTRADPNVPLGRLRARGELIEIRAGDLRFTAEEATAYLNDAMGLGLASGAIDALEGRTEGWIAALQLAALSMEGRDDVAAFIAGFTGDDRYIVDYLVEEVLGRQPAGTRQFLLETSILERLTAPLCDAITARGGARAKLEGLDRANLFIVPLDDHRRWYRYHQLFADVLRTRLLEEQPETVAALHRRASAWYEQNGEPSASIRHALSAGDVERAADLTELAIPAVRQARQLSLMEAWLRSLPDEVVAARPVLAVHHAGVSLMAGDLDAAERRLAEAERLLAASEGAAVVVDDAAFARLPASIAIYRAAIAQTAGDVAAAMGHARRALDLSGETDHSERAGASGFLALAHWRSGDLEHARDLWRETAANLERAGYLADAGGATFALADVLVAQGRLRDAARTYEDGLRLASERVGTAVRGAADLHVGLSEVLREWSDLDGAEQHLARSRDLGEHNGLPQNAHRWSIAMARVREARGDRDGAHDLLDQAEARFVRDFFPLVRPIPAIRARLWIRQGRLADAAAWAHDADLAPHDELSYLREYEHITLARLLLAQAAPEASELVQRLLSAAEAGGRTGAIIELLVLAAVARVSSGDRSAAMASLERALALAEPERSIRVFVDEGPSIALLLREAVRRPSVTEFASRLLVALDSRTDQAPSGQVLVEPLSERELEVLSLLRSDLDGPAMARHLFVSVNTLRTHTRNVYAKLGVTSRREAVRRADELGLRPRR